MRHESDKMNEWCQDLITHGPLQGARVPIETTAAVLRYRPTSHKLWASLQKHEGNIRRLGINSGARCRHSTARRRALCLANMLASAGCLA